MTDPRQSSAGVARPRGLLLQWHITHRCTHRCAHCYQERFDGDGELSRDELWGVLRDYEALLDRRRADAPHGSAVRGHITVTGGEPFVHAELPNLLERMSAARDRYSFALLTNGARIDVPLARTLRRLRPRFVQLSLEGGEATHDRVRGPGDFQRTLAAIRTLVRFGVRTLISFTAHRLNFREFPSVAEVGIRLRVARVWADRLIPCGHHPGTGGVEPLTAEDTREFFDLMASARARAQGRWFPRTEIAMHRALQFLAGGGEPYRCTAGDSLLTVMPNGDVYPCRRLPIVVGNLRQTPLETIYRTSPLLARLRERTEPEDGCVGCLHHPRCRGGLKCLAHAVHGDPFRRDPGCWLPRPDVGAARGGGPNERHA